jgi:hypothetical protein
MTPIERLRAELAEAGAELRAHLAGARRPARRARILKAS